MTDKTCLDYRKNSINALRILAAFQVMWGHIVEHLEISLPKVFGYTLEKAISWVLYFFNGVPIFFFLSGFLIYISIENKNSARSYYRNRFIRIYPELWAGVIVEIVCIIIFLNPIVWKELFAFAFTQATVLQFWTPDSLRGFGCGTPNGSLWTICVLIQFYVIAWPAKRVTKRIADKPIIWVALEVIFMIIGAATSFISSIVPVIVYKLYCQTLIQYFWIFWLGMLVANFRDYLIPVLSKHWHFFGLGAIALRLFPYDFMARNFRIVFTTLCLLTVIGMSYRFLKIRVKNDISYALFIYHMIVVNVFIELGFYKNIYSLSLCVILSVVLALLSTKMIGNKISRLKTN